MKKEKTYSYKVYLGKLYLGTYIATTPYEAIERCKGFNQKLNSQSNIKLWRTETTFQVKKLAVN